VLLSSSSRMSSTLLRDRSAMAWLERMRPFDFLEMEMEMSGRGVCVCVWLLIVASDKVTIVQHPTIVFHERHKNRSRHSTSHTSLPCILYRLLSPSTPHSMSTEATTAILCINSFTNLVYKALHDSLIIIKTKGINPLPSLWW
jgi:hypothetical protein